MGDREAAPEARQAPLVEHRADHPEVLVEHQLLAVTDGQPGRLLAAVLEREQAERGNVRGLGRLTGRQHRPEHAAHQEYGSVVLAQQIAARADAVQGGAERASGAHSAVRERARDGGNAAMRRPSG